MRRSGGSRNKKKKKKREREREERRERTYTQTIGRRGGKEITDEQKERKQMCNRHREKERSLQLYSHS